MLPNTDNTTVATVASTTSNKVGKAPVEVEEINTQQSSAEKAPSTKRAAETTEEPNPLLLDPYDFDRCAISILYSRIGDRQASVSVHNHKDDPIVKTLPLVEVPLPEQIACVIEQLLEIWPDGKVSATLVLLPQEEEAERRMVVSIRTGSDTPIVLTGAAAEFPLPPSITTLLDELKELLPARAMRKIEKDAKKNSKAAPRTSSGKAALPASGNVDGKTQMTLF